MQRLVHLDLKGAPPQIAYLEKVLELIQRAGGTGLLLEWEDTFPYSKDLTVLGGLKEGSQAYSFDEAKQILEAAKRCNLAVIPLVQTFGHMEFVLKHSQWQNLREVDRYPSSLCPTKNSSFQLVTKMVQQMINFHPDAEYIHIGADEVWHLGACSACAEVTKAEKFGKNSIYLKFVEKVADFIREHHPHIRIIMWDDMIRGMDLETLQSSRLGDLVEPMVWFYHRCDHRLVLGGDVWKRYEQLFGGCWAASAFKGATGSDRLVPDARHHLENNLGWLQLAEGLEKLRGVAITGWSRYDHFAVLCDPLPAAIPSLIVCLVTWLRGGFTSETLQECKTLLGCEVNLDGLMVQSSVEAAASFPGWQCALALAWVADVRRRQRAFSNSDQINTWFNPWQLRANFLNPMHLESVLSACEALLAEAACAGQQLRLHLAGLFHAATTEELIGCAVDPVLDALRRTKAECEEHLLRKAH